MSKDIFKINKSCHQAALLFLGGKIMQNNINLIREKISNYGTSQLTTAEILELITGKELPLLNDDAEDNMLLNNFIKKNINEMMYCYDLTKKQALLMQAILELNKRISTPVQDEYKILSPEDGAKYLYPKLSYKSTEHFAVILLNSKNRIIGFEIISQGSINSSVVHPREVFNSAIVNHAAGILAAHNHPSGDPTPSKEDKALTSSLTESGKMMGIPVLDHIIVGHNCYFSFKEHCLI